MDENWPYPLQAHCTQVVLVQKRWPGLLDSTAPNLSQANRDMWACSANNRRNLRPSPRLHPQPRRREKAPREGQPQTC